MADGTAAAERKGGTGGGSRFLQEYRVEIAMLGALLLLCVILSVAAPNFLTAGNLRNVLWQVAAVGIIAVGQSGG